MIFDTHIHFNDEKFNEDLKDVIDRSVDANVTHFALMGYDRDSSLKAIDIYKKYNNYRGIKIVLCVGLQPGEVEKEEDSQLYWLKDLINKYDVKCIGEIGLDLYWTQDTKDKQVYYFKKQLELAEKLDLPVSIHMREATQLSYDCIKDYKVKGIIHCFNGSVEMAKEFIKLGYKLGIGGVLTYKNTNLYKVIEELDISNFVLETDAPYLPPTPYRGQRNEPAYLVKVLDRICEIKKDLEREEIENILFNNSKDIFKI